MSSYKIDLYYDPETEMYHAQCDAGTIVYGSTSSLGALEAIKSLSEHIRVRSGRGSKWKPAVGEEYYFVGSDAKVGSWYNDGGCPDERMFRAGNCYKTCKEAEAAAERVKKAYRGE